MTNLSTSVLAALNVSNAPRRKAKLAVPASSNACTNDISTASSGLYLPSEILELIVNALIAEELLTFSVGADVVPSCSPLGRELNSVSSLLLANRRLHSITSSAMRGRQTLRIWDFQAKAAKAALLERLTALPSSGPWTRDLTIRLHVLPYLTNSDLRDDLPAEMPSNRPLVDDFEHLLGHLRSINSTKPYTPSSRWTQVDIRFHGMVKELFDRCPANTGPETWDKWTPETMEKALGCGPLERRMVFNQQLACLESEDCSTTERERNVLGGIRRKRDIKWEDRFGPYRIKQS